MALDFINRAEAHEASVRKDWGFVSEEALINFICDEQEFLVAQAEAELYRSRVRNDIDVIVIK